MKVIRAEVMGLCFGVRDALKAIEAIENPRAVTIHGQLVHNEVVIENLSASGFGMTQERDRSRIPETPDVLITAHGVSGRERSRLTGAGKRLLDTTCPLVTRAHEAAMTLAAEGYHVLVVGRRGHVEVQGITEDLEDCDVIETVDDVRAFEARKLGIICQTTTPSRLVERVRQAVADQNPQALIRFIDTVCLPTKEHQRALERLLGQVDAVVVVGGRNSNNTHELVALCRANGRPVCHIQSSADLDPNWLRKFETIGLTAGTSTLDRTIEEVFHALLLVAAEAVVI
jgi:4-hydroxy-3-methylbut-2-enyl diphosphate reductase